MKKEATLEDYRQLEKKIKGITPGQNQAEQYFAALIAVTGDIAQLVLKNNSNPTYNTEQKNLIHLYFAKVLNGTQPQFHSFIDIMLNQKCASPYHMLKEIFIKDLAADQIYNNHAYQEGLKYFAQEVTDYKKEHTMAKQLQPNEASTSYSSRVTLPSSSRAEQVRQSKNKKSSGCSII
ncbi:MAG: hypothetical protein AB8U25_03585 [Rickettsiales endosymbiont of Dermacentor nuttalli]